MTNKRLIVVIDEKFVLSLPVIGISCSGFETRPMRTVGMIYLLEFLRKIEINEFLFN